jgi:tetrahydromethanopterin S-methyltransferase subunit G
MSDLKDMSMEMYRQWEKSMATWWDGVLDDPAVVKGMGDNLATQARVRQGFEEQIDKTMQNMHLPSRSDVVRVARIASLLEDKVLALEDALLEQQDALQRIEKESLQGRIQQAESLVAVQERLDTIESKLDALLAAVQQQPAAEPKSANSRPRARSKATPTDVKEG